MRSKRSNRNGRAAERAKRDDASAGDARHIRADLESEGLAPELSEPVAQRLAAIAAELTPEEYSAVLRGVTAACRADAVANGQREVPTRAEDGPDVGELERLVADFRGELQKLEEGLRVLGAFAERMRGRVDVPADRVIH